MAFAKGASVVQVVNPIKGTVGGFSVDQETGEVQVRVDWTDAEGTLHSRFFKQDEIAAQEPAA
jgi:hypothetical protein